MDAITSALALLLLALGGVAMAMRSTASATVMIGQLFYVADAGWPSRIPEDDRKPSTGSHQQESSQSRKVYLCAVDGCGGERNLMDLAVISAND